jgi:hypothetical protein
VPSGSTGRIETEKGDVVSHKLDGEGSTSTSDTQAVRSHRSDGMEKGPTSSGPTGQMEKGPTSTRRMEKGSSGDFYDELQVSRMSNCRSHRFTLDGEGTMWRSMMKRRRYRSNIVRHRLVISSITKPYSLQF